MQSQNIINFSYYEYGEKRERYCGLASDTQSKKKALQFELEHLKEQKNNLTQKVIEIESKMKSL